MRVLVDAGAERHHGAHVLVARREALVERQAALDHGRRPVRDHVEVGGADGDRVDAHQHLGLAGHRHRLVRQHEIAGAVQHPRLHGGGNGKAVAAARRPARAPMHVLIMSVPIPPGPLRALLPKLGRQRPRRRHHAVAHARQVRLARAQGRRRDADGAHHGAQMVADRRADAGDARLVLLALHGMAVPAHQAQLLDQRVQRR